MTAGQNQELRFWARVRITETGCWLWTGEKIQGYGRFYLGAGKRIRAHLWAYRRYVGPIPQGLQPDHTCRNRACVNPLHLEPVTRKVNILRGVSPTAKNARKTHCKRGHPLSGKNLRIDPGGGRRCLICRQITNARRHR